MVLVSQRNSDRAVPKLGDFATAWVRASTPSWKASYLETVEYTLDRWIIPTFQDWLVDRIDREVLMEYRAAVVAHERRPSPARVNKIMSILGALLTEAAARYGFDNPASGIRRLRERTRDIQPFTLDEVNRLLLEAPPEWSDYYCVRFFTGMRTAEVDGLRWRYVDFQRRQILVRETVVLSRPDTTKNESSEREIDMVPQVLDALIRQWRRTGERGEYVFCARNGSPLRHGNMRKRVWLPLLNKLGMSPRRQYGDTAHVRDLDAGGRREPRVHPKANGAQHDRDALQCV